MVDLSLRLLHYLGEPETFLRYQGIALSILSSVSQMEIAATALAGLVGRFRRGPERRRHGEGCRRALRRGRHDVVRERPAYPTLLS